MSNNKATNIPWPPIISSCPDYWTDTPDEPPSETSTSIPIPHVPGSRCIGTMGQNTGNYTFNAINSKCSDKTLTTCDPDTCDNCKTATVDFTSTGLNYTGANGNCQKQTWAKGYGNISWDGITYGFGEQNPCWTP